MTGRIRDGETRKIQDGFMLCGLCHQPIRELVGGYAFGCHKVCAGNLIREACRLIDLGAAKPRSRFNRDDLSFKP